MKFLLIGMVTLGVLNVLILRKVNKGTKNFMSIQERLAALGAAVSANQATDSAAVELLVGLNAKLAAAIAAASGAGATEEQLAELNRLTSALGQSTEGLAAAVVANTPAAEVAPEEAPADPAPAEEAALDALEEPAPAADETDASETADDATADAGAAETETAAESAEADAADESAAETANEVETQG